MHLAQDRDITLCYIIRVISSEMCLPDFRHIKNTGVAVLAHSLVFCRHNHNSHYFITTTTTIIIISSILIFPLIFLFALVVLPHSCSSYHPRYYEIILSSWPNHYLCFCFISACIFLQSCYCFNPFSLSLPPPSPHYSNHNLAKLQTKEHRKDM